VTEEMVITIAKDVLLTAALCSAPALLAGLAVGLLISIFQAVTQINEMTLTFIPKIVAAAAAMALTYGFVLHHLLDFTTRMFTLFPHLTR
jgi:flagellar biosynthetic protein FliQ